MIKRLTLTLTLLIAVFGALAQYNDDIYYSKKKSSNESRNITHESLIFQKKAAACYVASTVFYLGSAGLFIAASKDATNSESDGSKSTILYVGGALAGITATAFLVKGIVYSVKVGKTTSINLAPAATGIRASIVF